MSENNSVKCFYIIAAASAFAAGMIVFVSLLLPVFIFLIWSVIIAVTIYWLFGGKVKIVTKMPDGTEKVERYRWFSKM